MMSFIVRLSFSRAFQAADHKLKAAPRVTKKSRAPLGLYNPSSRSGRTPRTSLSNMYGACLCMPAVASLSKTAVELTKMAKKKQTDARIGKGCGRCLSGGAGEHIRRDGAMRWPLGRLATKRRASLSIFSAGVQSEP